MKKLTLEATDENVLNSVVDDTIENYTESDFSEDRYNIEGLSHVISEMVEQILKMVNDMYEGIAQAFLAMSEVLVDVSRDICITNTESIRKLIEVMRSIPSDSYLFDERYEEKVRRYRHKYRKPAKRFLNDHPMLQSIIIAVVADMILMGIKYTGAMIVDKTETKNPVKYELQYDSDNQKLNVEINLDDKCSENEIYLPDGTNVVFSTP